MLRPKNSQPTPVTRAQAHLFRIPSILRSRNYRRPAGSRYRTCCSSPRNHRTVHCSKRTEATASAWFPYDSRRYRPGNQRFHRGSLAFALPSDRASGEVLPNGCSSARWRAVLRAVGRFVNSDTDIIFLYSSTLANEWTASGFSRPGIRYA